MAIVGGGAAGLEPATWLGRRLGKRKAASITLVDRSRTHVWKPLLHEVASGSLDSEVDAIEFIPHAFRHGYRYRIGAMYGIDRQKRQIYVEPSYDEEGQEVIPRRMIGYDTLVIAGPPLRSPRRLARTLWAGRCVSLSSVPFPCSPPIESFIPVPYYLLVSVRRHQKAI